ncbi:MAG: ATP-binding protein [Nitrospinota bacterium]
MATVLIVGPESGLARKLEDACAGAGHAPRRLAPDAAAGRLEDADLVLVDLTGPGPDYTGVLGPLNLAPYQRFVPVVAVTADRVEARVAALEAGAHECIGHPFHVAELQARMAGLLKIKTLQDTVVAHEMSLAEANRELIRLSTRKDDFIAKLSHELRTPLTAVCEFASLVLDDLPGTLTATQRECLEAVRSNGRHLAAMIEDLLHLSCIESGGMTLAIEHVDLPELAAETLQGMAPQAQRQGLRLALVTDREQVPVRGDRQRLRQVLGNLVSNAIKFTPEGGGVTVGVREESARSVARLEVSDTGPGLDAEQRRRAFDRFYQGDPEGMSKSGLGLGLSICAEIVTLHGGRIDVKSQPGEGSCFAVELPLAAADAGRATASAAGPEGEDLP